MIVLEDASYRYPGDDAWALRPISLELRGGDPFALPRTAQPRELVLPGPH